MWESLAKFLLAALMGLIPLLGLAGPPRIQVFGLFKDRAVVEVNGQQKVLTAGKPTREGIKLIRASSSKAVIEVNGEVREYTLGSNVSTGLEEPESTVVRIPSTQGMYLTDGLINGRPVKFLVDTGASHVAIGSELADELGINYRSNGKVVRVSTADRMAKAWNVKLGNVAVGGISLNQIDGMVIDMNHDKTPLLGMSFLGRLKVTHEESLMVLEKKR